MSVFYWTIFNLPSVYCSNLRSIQLLEMIKAGTLKLHGPSKILRPFLDQLLKFQDGVEITVRGISRVWHAILLHFAGDMPASNYIGGFKETGSAQSSCRVCCITRQELDYVFDNDHCVLRDKDSYTDQVNALVDDSLFKQEIATLKREYGINGPFVILSVHPYFDSTKCLPHDLMHGAHEAVF